jgi:hypothetical protein
MNEIEVLENLHARLEKAASLHEKLALLDELPSVQKFLQSSKILKAFLSSLAIECEFAFKQLIAIGQAERLLAGIDDSNFQAEVMRRLIEKLVLIDHFYRELGGVVGYQAKIRSLLQEMRSTEDQIFSFTYHSPHFVDISEESELTSELSSWGIESLPEMAEMYPLGGAADRLHLVDETSGLEMPAARLNFSGKSLLELLIQDLQAREFLYFKKYGKQLTTPIAIMTSHEKDNHAHVVQMCRDANWFGRPQESFRFFLQPLVPTVNGSGDWCFSAPLKPIFKPGGHGAIWKLARDEGVFKWLKGLGRKKALVRQINNPLAGLDRGLLSFIGYGWKKEMLFGFASCPRLLQAAEGINVLIERKKEAESEWILTNIEYCDFAKFGIQDQPLREGEPYSRFSSNTNILFIDIDAVSSAIDTCPFPGLLINLKNGSYLTESGEKVEEPMARLESTMQNIADVFIERKPAGGPPETSRTFITYNHRLKTISTAKKAYVPGKSHQETPENCFYDLLSAARDLLEGHCGFIVPPKRAFEEYLKQGPDMVFLYHPSLGPFYSQIKKKLQGGKLDSGAELQLEIAEIEARSLEVKGSLQVTAEQILGSCDSEGILQYSDQVGRCILENVKVNNRGVVWERSGPYWKMDLKREESLQIVLKGRSLFSARDVCFEGAGRFVVEEGMEMRVSQRNGTIKIERFPFPVENHPASFSAGRERTVH